MALETELKLLQNNPALEPILIACEPSEITCPSISDSFCEELWKPGVDGNLKTRTGMLELGKSSKSDLSLVRKKDLNIFVEAVPRLPSYLKNRASLTGLISKLESHLEKENDTKVWSNELAAVMFQINTESESAASEEFLRLHPELKDKKESDYTPEEESQLGRFVLDMSNQILDAKYKEQPSWKQVESIYQNVREQLQAVIQETTLSQTIKDQMKAKVASVELTLPYTDPKLLGANGSCGVDEMNAFYMQSVNKFTVCAGILNSIDSLGALTMIIAHELAHSVDLSSQALDAFQKTPIAKINRKLFQTSGPITSCAEWNKAFAEGAFNLPVDATSSIDPVFDKFKSCLISKENLIPFSFQNVLPPVNYNTDMTISNFASANLFSLFTTPEVMKKGKLEANEFYMRPDIERFRDSGFAQPNDFVYSPSPTLYFTQLMLCGHGQDKPRDLKKLSEAERTSLFTTSINQTKFLMNSHLLQLYKTCGDECRELNNFNLSRSSGENFSDWMASRVATKVLKDKAPEVKLDFAKEMGTLFCDRPENSYDQNLMVNEKQFSKEVHADNRVRRWSLFSPQLSSELGCKIDPEKNKGFNQCEL
jgi:hypothetical protein